ncbi:MAG: alcohol dehydrogenase catalytic domain-containing protein [Armatimonadetes bacterium]|nr:alcohol dehydrogenase catalytic domain-containing protein [Armatimonadota bacterium]
MRALVLSEPGSLSVKNVEIPYPGPGELVIRVRAATTCGTDLKAFQRGHPMIPMPGPLGHEYSGTVVLSGEGAPFEVGQDIMGVHSAPCQECYWCLVGQENLCEKIMATKVLGSYAEYLHIPAHIARVNVFEKPKTVTFERAALLEPLACVAQAVQQLQPRVPTDRVLIIGPGAIGLLFVAALRKMGIHDVTLAGRNRARLAVGEELGARAITVQDIERTLGNGYDAVIECTGSVEVWESSINYVRRGGKLMLFGGCPKGTHVAFDTNRVHYDQISIMSPFHFGTSAVKLAREWLLDFGFVVEPVLSGDRALEDAPLVFEELKAGKGLKYVIRP